MAMTQEERAAEDARTEKERPLREWAQEIAATDKDLPRALEDIIDALDAPARARIAEVTLDKYYQKKQVRNRKPKGV